MNASIYFITHFLCFVLFWRMLARVQFKYENKNALANQIKSS